MKVFDAPHDYKNPFAKQVAAQRHLQGRIARRARVIAALEVRRTEYKVAFAMARVLQLGPPPAEILQERKRVFEALAAVVLDQKVDKALFKAVSYANSSGAYFV